MWCCAGYAHMVNIWLTCVDFCDGIYLTLPDIINVILMYEENQQQTYLL